jgi:hypothetical protein
MPSKKITCGRWVMQDWPTTCQDYGKEINPNMYKKKCSSDKECVKQCCGKGKRDRPYPPPPPEYYE